MPALSGLMAEAEPEKRAACDQVLAAMQLTGGRLGWHADELVERTGLGVAQVAKSLLLLELTGRVRESGLRLYAPT